MSHTFRKDDSTLIFGRQPVLEALEGDKQVDRIFLKKGASDEFVAQLRLLARQKGIPVNMVPIEKLNRLTRKNHQGVAAFVAPIQFYQIEDVVSQVFDDGEIPLIMVLDGITDVHNFGAIARTAWCTGCHAILIGMRDSAPVNGASIKASAGALLEIPVCRSYSIGKSLRQLQEYGFRIYGAEATGSKSLESAELNIPLAFVMGAEGMGIDDESKRYCDEHLSIPMLRKFDSYNVSVSAAMLLYETMRQRNTSK